MNSAIGGGHMIRNVRPGIAYRADNKTIVGFDVYDATSEIKSHYSVGIETTISDNVKVRVGNYHGAMTYGLGYNIDKKTQINYAYLAGNLGGTNMLGFQTAF